MRTAPAIAAVTLALAVPAAASGAAWQPDVRSARAYAAKRAGDVSFAVRTPHAVYGYRGRRVVPSASVVKAMLMVAYLDRVGRRPLRPADRALLRPMITRSDNAAASRVRDVVGYGSLYRLARRAHMGRFHASGSWGDTRITAAGQARLLLHIDRYVPRRHRAYALFLLGHVTRSQRWGIGRVRPPGWARYFKGGWGDGAGEVDHQVVLLRRADRRVAVAVMTTANPSKRYGDATLRGVFRRLLTGLGPRSEPR